MSENREEEKMDGHYQVTIARIIIWIFFSFKGHKAWVVKKGKLLSLMYVHYYILRKMIMIAENILEMKNNNLRFIIVIFLIVSRTNLSK